MRTGLHAVWSALGALRSFVSNFVLPHARGRGPTSTSKPSPAPGISCIGSFALALVLVLLSPSPAAAQVTTSAQLNGSGTFTIPGLYLGANITLEGWVYLRSSVAAPSLVEVGTGGSSYLVVLRVGDGTGKPYIAVYDALGNLVSQATSPIAIPLNTWVHLAGTIENNAGSISRIYINGVHVYAVAYGGTGAPAVSRNVNYIGRSATGEPNLDGFVADVRIWNLARTPDQIKAGMPFGSIAQPTTGLTAAYPFGATGQPVLNDVSGNNRTLTPSGTILYQTAGPASPLPGPPMDVSAADLGGVGSLTFAPTGTLGGSLTLEGWVNPRSQANGGRIVDVGTSTNKATLLASSTTNGRPALSIDVGGSNVLSLAAINPIPSNGWSHVAGVLNADRSAQLYVNGQLVASGTASQAFSASAPVTGFVGAGRNPGDALLNASLADVRIWTTGRTAAQVQSTMPAGSITGPATGLLAAYPFGQTGQPILNDVSGNNVTLTQAGTIQFKATAPPIPRTSSAWSDGASGSYLTMGSVVDVTGAFTLEGWVRPSIHQSDARVVDYGQGKDNVLLMSSQLASGKPSLVVNSAGLAVLSITAPDALPLNTWSHVAGVINADRTAALYVNGRLVASGTASQLPNMTAAVASLSGLIGGSRLGGLSINGGMADVRIWTVGRTQAEIQASMPVGSVTGPVTGLVAAYPFGATGEGAYNDVSGNGRTLTASGDVRFQVLGPSSPSAAATDADVTADLKGSAYYTLGTIPAGRTFTIEAWVNPRNYIDFGRIVDLGNAGYPNDNILLLFADGGDTRPGLMVTYGTDGSSYATKALYPIPLNAWSHIAGTIDSAGVLRIFVNGRLEASATAPPRAANIVARSNSRIGANTAISQVFNGSIADVRIWNYPRSEAQIRATMPVGSVSGPAVGLIRAYPLGSTGADVLSDVALSGNPLTQVGSPEYRKTGSGFLVAQGFQGSASLVTSAGQLTLLGNNTYTGATTIGGGAVLVGNGGTSGTLGTGKVANSGILTFNRSDNLTVAGAISGSGPLFKQGAGALTLSGTNSFTGGLTVQGGTVAVAGGMANNATNVITVNSGATFLMGNNSLLGGHDATPLTPFVVQSGGVLQAGDGLFNVVGPITLRGGTLRATSGRADANGWSFAFRGTVTVDGGAVTSVLEGPGLALGATSVASGTFDVADGSAADDLVVSGGLMNGPASTFPNMQASSLVKTGAGRMTLTGSNAYTGTTTVSAGTLQVGNGGTSGTLGAGNVVNNAALAFNRSDAFTVANAISGTGTLAQQGSGTLVLSGANSYSGASTISSGALQVGAGGATGSLGSGNVVNNGALILNRNDAFTVPNVVSGPGTLTVQGGGIATLTGANTYAGTSTISAGTLQVGNGGTTGALGSGSVVNNGTLAFNRSDNITVANVVSGTGGLLKQGNGTVTLSSANTFTGATEITAGTLALGASGTLGTSSRIALSGGAALDVTARSAGLVLPSGRTLANTGGSATLRGNIDASAPTLSLSFDGTNPSFSVVNGTLTLAANTQVQVSKTGSAMSAGLYRIISKGSGGAVSGVAPAAVTVTGAGTGGLATSLFVVNGELLLQVGTPVTINLGNLAQTYNATPRPVSITTTPAGISTAVTYNGGTTVPTAAGTYAVSATITAPGYYGSASGSLVISKAPAMVRLGNLFQNYDGTARRALAITDPSGLSVNFTYGGNANAPTNQGVYNVVATINDTNYSGVTNGILRVRAATPGSLAAPTSQPPAYVNHQGFLSDASGTPLGSPNPRNYDLIFRIYSGPSGGSSLWTEYQNVTLDQGRYSVMLGDGQNVGIEPWPRIDGVLASGSGSSRYLQVTVRGLGVGGSDVTLMPRFLLASQPYAFLARHAATADTLVDSNGVPVIRVSGNSVGINVEQPNAMLDVGGVLAADSVATSANATISGTLTAGSFVGRGTFPLGTIVAWTGGDAPNGWALCDGRTVNGRRTPDLRGRFVVGQGQGPGLSSRLSGQTGGEESVTLSTLNMGQHNHVFDPGPATSSGGGSHSHNYDTHAGLGFGIVNSNPANPWGNSNRTRSMWVNRSMSHDEGPHDHAFSVSAWSSGAGLGQAHPNMPPFHVLAYIMRVQ